MDGHGQARTNTDRLVREYGISQDPHPATHGAAEIVANAGGGGRTRQTHAAQRHLRPTPRGVNIYQPLSFLFPVFG
jgi:hypothetical protein